MSRTNLWNLSNWIISSYVSLDQLLIQLLSNGWYIFKACFWNCQVSAYCYCALVRSFPKLLIKKNSSFSQMRSILIYGLRPAAWDIGPLAQNLIVLNIFSQCPNLDFNILFLVMLAVISVARVSSSNLLFSSFWNNKTTTIEDWITAQSQLSNPYL